MRLGVILALGLALLTSAGHAEEIWGPWRAAGNGCKNRVDVIRNGTALSILFNDFHIDMTDRDDRLADVRNCVFSIEVNPPENSMLAAVKQVFSGGLIKSKGAMAEMILAYRIGPLRRDQNVKWPNAVSISPDNPDSVFTKTFYDPLPTVRCREKHPYNISVQFRALRTNRKDFLVGGLDSIDTEGIPNINLIPEWQKCIQRPNR